MSLRYEADINGHWYDIRGERQSGGLYDEEGLITNVGGSREDMERLEAALRSLELESERRGRQWAIDTLSDNPVDKIRDAITDASWLGKSVTNSHAAYLAVKARKATIDFLQALRDIF